MAGLGFYAQHRNKPAQQKLPIALLCTSTKSPSRTQMLLIPPPIYGAVTLFAMWLLYKNYPILSTQATWPLQVGIAIALAGLLVEILAVLSFRRAQTTINPLRPDNTTALVTEGIYSLSRNPMYLGMAIMLTGAAMIMRSLSPVFMPLVFCAVVTVMQIIPEERTLQLKFGADFENYKRAVGRWL